jgi:DNA-directed RNA polymerase subunit alpha
MSILAFQKPDKVVMQKASDFHGIFDFYPLERGFGVTIGNAIRRTLLSSLEGYAVTSIRIPGVDHEFAAINGVREDVVDIILNVKQIRFKKVGGDEDSEKVFISISGKDQITAGDIGKSTNIFKVLNPDIVICNLEPSVNLELELTINKGRGYVLAEDNKPEEAPIGLIPVDSVFTPVINVKFDVENTRVGQSIDFDKLTIELLTDGSIHPEDALKEASHILSQHFMLFTDKNITLDSEINDPDKEVDEKFLHTRKLLKTPLTDLDLSVRAYNCLRAAEIKTLGDLVKYDIADLLKFRNFGKKSLTELENLVKSKNLTFGMDVSKFKLDEE